MLKSFEKIVLLDKTEKVTLSERNAIPKVAFSMFTHVQENLCHSLNFNEDSTQQRHK